MASTTSVSRGLPSPSASDTVAALSAVLPTNTRDGPGGAAARNLRDRRVALGPVGNLVRGVELVDQIAEPRVGPVPDLKPRRPAPASLRVAEADDLVLFQLVEHQARVGLARAIGLAPGEGQTADLVPLIVEEDQAGDGPRAIDRLAVDDARVHPILVRDDHAQRSVGVDDVDPLGGDFSELLRRRPLPEGRRAEHGEDEGVENRVGAQELNLTAERPAHGRPPFRYTRSVHESGWRVSDGDHRGPARDPGDRGAVPGEVPGHGGIARPPAGRAVHPFDAASDRRGPLVECFCLPSQSRLARLVVGGGPGLGAMDGRRRVGGRHGDALLDDEYRLARI